MAGVPLAEGPCSCPPHAGVLECGGGGPRHPRGTEAEVKGGQAMLGSTLIIALAVTATHARPGQKGKTPILGWNTWCTQNSCGVDWCTSAEVGCLTLIRIHPYLYPYPPHTLPPLPPALASLVSGGPDDVEVELAPGQTRCPVCSKAIPEAALVMHEINCSRAAWQCGVCRKRVPAAAKSAHMALHKEVDCTGCGCSLPASDMPSHRAAECSGRWVTCTYCALPVMARNLTSHTESCAARKYRCHQCGRQVATPDLQQHGFTFVDAGVGWVPPST
eukprot:gene5325-5357_t